MKIYGKLMPEFIYHIDVAASAVDIARGTVSSTAEASVQHAETTENRQSCANFLYDYMCI